MTQTEQSKVRLTGIEAIMYSPSRHTVVASPDGVAEVTDHNRTNEDGSPAPCSVEWYLARGYRVVPAENVEA